MKDLQFTVNDQEIRLDNKRCGNGLIVQGSRNYLRLKFRFKNWDEFEKHIQFIDEDEHYDFLLDDDDSVKVPNKFIEDKSFKFLLVGYYTDEDERVTTNTLQIKLSPTEFSDDIHSYEDDTEDVYRYLVNCIDGKADASDLDNYVLTSKILSDISLATDNTQLVGAKELKDEMDELRGEVPTGVEVQANKMSSWADTPTNVHYPSEKLVKDSLDLKVDKVDGKGLSANDFTDSYKSSLDDLKTVAFTGSYNDLSNKPSIPSKISDLDNDSDFIETSSTEGLVKNDGSIDTTSYSTFDGNYNNLSNKPSIPSASSDLSDGSDLIKKNNTQGLIKNDGTVDTSTYATKDYVDELVGEAISYIVGSEE